MSDLETLLEAFEERPVVYDPAEIVRAGAFVSIDSDGDLRIERGYVRPGDEPLVEPVEGDDGDASAASQPNGAIERAVITLGAGSTEPDSEAEEDDGLNPLSERLITELTAHRTLALRDALANDPGVAFAAVLHALCLGAFYRMSSGTCLEISAKSASFTTQASGLADSASAKAIEARHQQCATCPRTKAISGRYWSRLIVTGKQRCLRICASLSVNAVHEPWNRNPRRIVHADALARAVNLDMAAAGWSATVDNYLGRVPKARILEAVREAKGEASAQLIDHLKKPEMAKEASGCSPARAGCPSRCARRMFEPQKSMASPKLERILLADSEDDGGDATASDPDEDQSHAVAAE
jgi:ParB family transcriptional regulator, chromosome partitioning protein